jgi:threonine/homoserine/homoserine lactone efflux protein
MAWRIVREGGALKVAEDRSRTSARRIVTNAVLLNLLNPKLSLFFLAFLPQFVPGDANNATATMVGLASTFMLLTFIVFVGYGACASLARDLIVSRPRVMRWLRLSFAGAFGLLGLRLALSDR